MASPQNIFSFCLVLFALYSLTEARYLPTRSNDDRLDKLRDLLKDLLEGEVEKPTFNNFDRRLLFKRETSGTEPGPGHRTEPRANAEPSDKKILSAHH